MSVFKKLKDVLFDFEEEDETPVIERKKPVIDDNPIKEIKMPREEARENHQENVEPVKKSHEFNFPLDFEDEMPSRSRQNMMAKEYNDERRENVQQTRPTPPPKPYYREERTEKRSEEVRDYSKFLEPKKEEKKRIFTPSPVISPVYGILNQNYTKDDVIVKTDVGVKSPSLEDVRKKAYTKKKETEKKIENESVVVEKDEFDDSIKTLDEILTANEDINSNDEKVNKNDNTNSLEDDLLTIEKLDQLVENNEEENKTDSLEKDLFNLIDSMYEDKEDEE